MIKKILIMICLFISILEAKEETIEINGLKYSRVSTYYELSGGESKIEFLYNKNDVYIDKIFTQGKGDKDEVIKYRNKDFCLTSEKRIDNNKQEKQDMFKLLNLDGDMKWIYEKGITYSKDDRCDFFKCSMKIKDHLSYISYIANVTLNDEKNGNKNSYHFDYKDYYFDENGKIKKIDFDGVKREIYCYESYSLKNVRINTVKDLDKSSTSQLKLSEAALEEYIQDNNYILKEKEIVNGKEIDTLIMKFNKEYEVEEITMVKIDYLDNTINGWITWKFEKGKIISEERSK